MTKDAIFQAFLSTPKVLSISELRGDLSITNLGINARVLSYWNQLNEGFKLIEVVSGDTSDVFDDHECGNPDFFSEKYPVVLEKGSCDGWVLTGVSVSMEAATICFVELWWLRGDPEAFREEEVDTDYNSPWFQKNCVSLVGLPTYFRFIIGRGEDLAYVVEYRGDETEMASYVEITEVISEKKTRMFRRWFVPQNVEEAWEVINYYVPAD